MQKAPISVFIIAKNEADRIGAAIRSVKDWTDEVIVVDSGSADTTMDVSRAMGATTTYHDWQGYGRQKRHGESLCRNMWILNIDADEEVSDDLRDEIIRLFTGPPPTFSAYRLTRTELYSHHRTPHQWSPTTDWVRLYRKDLASYRDDPVHDSVVVRSGQVGNLRGHLYHHSFRSYKHHIDKVNDYSDAQAERLWEKGRNPSWLALLLTPPIAFLKALFVRRLIVYGIDGIITSYIISLHRLIRLAKAREKFQQSTKNPRPN